MARKDGLPLRGHPVLLCPGPAVQAVRPPGVKAVPSGASCQRTGESSSWSSPDSCTARCGRGICCVVCPRSWSGKASVSAPPPPSLATAFLRRVRSAGPATTCQRKTLRIQQRGGRKGPVGPSELPGFSVAGELSQTSHLLNGHGATLPCLTNRLQ